MILLLVSLCACKQEEVLTEGEKTAQTVQTYINENNIKTANLYLGSVRRQYDAPFSIERGFLVFRGSSPSQYYNLSQLTRFEIAPNAGNGPVVIQFYFRDDS
jgi:hypothetical protein